MAITSVAHDGFKKSILDGPAWTSKVMHAGLFLANAWTPAAADAFLADAVAAGAVELTVSGYARVVLSGQTTALDNPNMRANAECNTISFSAPAAGQSYNKLVVFEVITDDAHSPLAITYDLGGTFATAGVALTYNIDASGLFVLA